MKNTEKKTRIITKIVGMFTLTATLLFSGCAKDGAIGPAGTDGVDGNANVKSIVYETTNWVNATSYWSLYIPYNAITQSIIDNGAVLVYLKNGTSYSQLPFTYYTSSTRSETFEVENNVGSVNIYYSSSNLILPSNPGSCTFKIVVIAASDLVKNPNVNTRNYNEVATAYNL